MKLGIVSEASGSYRQARLRRDVRCIGHTLSVTLTGDGEGIVTSPSRQNGWMPRIRCGSGGSTCIAHFAPDESVTLTATADPGSYAVGCTESTEGDPEDATDCVVTMDEDEHVVVEFGVPPTEDLTVTMTGGDGTIISEPAGIDCTRSGGVTSGTCTAELAGTVSLTTTLPNGSLVTDYSGDGTTDGSGVRQVRMDAPRSVSVDIPTAPQIAAFITLQTIQYLEAVSLMTPLFPFPMGGASYSGPSMAAEPAGEACPTLLGAADGGAFAFDACTGEVVQEYPFAGDRFYDAIGMVPPAGMGGRSQLLVTGQNWVHCYVEDSGVTDSCAGLAYADVPDAQPLAEDDPTAGAVMVDRRAGVVRFVVFSPAHGYFDCHPDWIASGYHVSGQLASAVASGAPYLPFTPPDEALVVSWSYDGGTEKLGLLYHVDMDARSEDPEPVGTRVGELSGNDPRRIRCDLGSGICAVSDFAHDLLTIILWDGAGLPTIGEATAAGQIADGPVGIDVFGHRIVTAGFNDDHYTIIEVDGAGGILSTTTSPLPEGCTQPGHAMFLEDGANTVVVSCWGSGGIAYIPNAF